MSGTARGMKGKLAGAVLMAGVLAAAVPAVAVDAKAQDGKPPAVTQAVPGMKRTVLQKFDVPGTNYETLIIRIECEPNLDIARHTHPGPEGSYVLEGEVTYLIDAEAPALRKAGESITLPSGTIHGAKIGSQGAVLLGSYIMEKGKPLMTKAETPAPVPPQP